MDPPYHISALLVGVFGHRAGVDHIDVGLRRGRHYAVALGYEHPFQGRSLGEVQLAPESYERHALHLPLLSAGAAARSRNTHGFFPTATPAALQAATVRVT